MIMNALVDAVKPTGTSSASSASSSQGPRRRRSRKKANLPSTLEFWSRQKMGTGNATSRPTTGHAAHHTTRPARLMLHELPSPGPGLQNTSTTATKAGPKSSSIPRPPTLSPFYDKAGRDGPLFLKSHKMRFTINELLYLHASLRW